MIQPLTLRAKIITVSIFLLILLALLIKLKIPFNFYDEGLVLVSAVRVSHGEIPYRDFWGIYPPGQFYIIGGLFKILGENLIPIRIYDTLTRFALVIGVFLVIKKLTAQHWFALFTAGIAGIMVASAGFYVYPVFPAMGLGIWAVWCWLNYAGTAQKRWLIATGILLGLASLLRWDVALYAAFGILFAGYLSLLFCPIPDIRAKELNSPVKRFSILDLFTPLKSLIWLVGPMLVVTLTSYSFLAAFAGWQNLFSQVVYFPVAKLHDVRWLAYPSIRPSRLPPPDDWMLFYYPLIVLALVVISAVAAFILKRGKLDSRFFGVLALAAYGAMLFNQALSRYDYIHVLPSAVLTFMVCAAGSSWVLHNLPIRLVRYVIYLFLAVTTLIYIRPAYKELRTSLLAQPPWGCYSHLAKVNCLPVDSDQAKAVQYIQMVTQPSDPIFVGNLKHDEIFVSDVGFYYLAGRPVATRYQELHPGSANTLPVQQEIAAEIEAKKVQWIVLMDMWKSGEPNGSARSTGVFFLDDYLKAKYQPVTSMGRYNILQRRRGQ